MKAVRIGVLALVVMAGVATAQTNMSAFFRISSPSNSVITGFDPVAGTISWSNDVAGVTNQLQRAYVLNGTSNWVDFVQLASTNGNATGTERIIDLDLPTNMVLIPGGWFQMGDSFGEGWGDELPVHSVYISPFYMDKYEVTKELWDEVYHWATNHSYSFDNPGLGKAENHPVHSVHWYDMVKWCNARSEMEGKTPAYYISGIKTSTNIYRTGQVDVQNDWVSWSSGYHLPTEAEWEKAARGGLNGKRFPWGDLITHSNANYNSTGGEVYDVSPTHEYHPAFNDGIQPYTSPAGFFAPNGYGLHDMAGNVWEWCWDRPDNYATAPYLNPKGALTGDNRTCRGCGWKYWAVYCRPAFRSEPPPSTSINYAGFRSVLPAK